VAVAPASQYGSSFLLEAVQSFQQEKNVTANPRDELKLYLKSDVESTDNVITWWGVRFTISF